MNQYGFNDARGGTPHAKYVGYAQATVGLTGKRVLEVGGCSPPAVIAAYRPLAWHCVNLDSMAVDSFNRQATEAGLSDARANVGSAADFRVEGPYDVVYSINAFEHIKPLDAALHRMAEALRQGGHLFSLFGPIWSCDVGHHLSIATETEIFHFNDGVLAPWEHLTSTPDQMLQRLAQKYGGSTAARIVEFVYTFPDLNRLTESDFERLFLECGLETVLLLRNKTPLSPPDVPGAGRARELMVVLKKGMPYPLEGKIRMARFALAFLRQKLLPQA